MISLDAVPAGASPHANRHHLSGFAVWAFLLASAVSMRGLEVLDQPPLSLGAVLSSVTKQYPPYLGALIERDVAEGRLRSATGAFDFQAFAKVFNKPEGFYPSTTTEAGFEQFTGLWGSTIFGGYRQTEGFLPDYYDSRRTDAGGTPSVGVKIPLLRDGAIDARRAALYRARLERERVEPRIQRQLIDFGSAAMKAYFNWGAAGQKLLAAESLLQVAREREDGIQTQIEKGLVAPVVSLENRQLVVSREIALTRAQRDFETSSITLSLFYRDEEDRPVIPGRSRLPVTLPDPEKAPSELLPNAIRLAAVRRPEIRQIELELDGLDVDRRLYRNRLLPQLNTILSASQGLGASRYKDTGELEIGLGLELRIPLERNQAKGQLEENRAKIRQVEQMLLFAANRIVVEVQSAHAAMTAAREQLAKARLNVQLAGQLAAVERDRFTLGASDLLALQIREQADYRARLDAITAAQEYFTALADFLAAIAVDFRELQTAPISIASITSWEEAKGDPFQPKAGPKP